MAKISKAQQNCVGRYNKKTYDSYLLRLKKGGLDVLRAQADAAGKSLNAYIVGLIEGETPIPVPQAPQHITPEALEQATQAAQAAGEDLEAWISRAIDDTAARDNMMRLIKR